MILMVNCKSDIALKESDLTPICNWYNENSHERGICYMIHLAFNIAYRVLIKLVCQNFLPIATILENISHHHVWGNLS